MKKVVLLIAIGALVLGLLIHIAKTPGAECDYCGSTNTTDCERFWKCHECGGVFW